MATLEQNVYRAIDDFNAIENAIVGKGVPVPAGTPTSEYAEKVEDVFEAGKKSEYDAFWDSQQNGGDISDYELLYAGSGWNDTTFSPKYDLRPTKSAYSMFWKSKITDLVAILERNGVVLDFSQSTNMQMTFHAAVVTRLGVIDGSKSTTYSDTFSHNVVLARIEKFIVNPSAGAAQSPFTRNISLNHMIVEGTIAFSTFNISWSPLNKASLISVINALSATTTGLTVTLRLAAVNTAFETTAGAADGSTSDEWTALIATKPNWTINLINS